mgnify:CR=1 FL=1
MGKRKGPEASIEESVRREAEAAGFLFWKFTSTNRVGVPDRILVSPWGLVTFWEFKRPGEDLAPRGPQARRAAELTARGAMVVVCDDIDRGAHMLAALATPEAYEHLLQSLAEKRADDAPRIITAPVPDSRH